MAKETKLIDLITGKEPIELDGMYLCAKTERDGYTETHQGNYWYLVEKDGVNYKVTPSNLDEKTGKFVKTDDPIIITEDTFVFYVVGTNRDSYTFPILRKEEITSAEVLEKQILQAFIAFIEDRFRFGVYNIFVVEDPTVVAP